MREILGGIFIIMGMFVLFISLLGMLRFRYVLNRMHAAAIADTLGLLLVILGLVFISEDLFHALKLCLVVVFLWLTSPVACHTIAKVEMLTNEHYEERLGEK